MTILVLCTKSYRQAIAALHGNHGTELDGKRQAIHVLVKP